MTVYCYPTPGKLKAQLICEAFAAGCDGQVVHDGRLRDGPAAFYGISPGMESLWRQVQDGRDWWFIDNAYIDSVRGKYFRVTRNRLQHSGRGASTGQRFKALGVGIKPWQTGGRHVVLCPQSEHFMRTVAGYGGDWTTDTIGMLQTRREIRVRPWLRNKGTQAASLTADLVGAHALVTWSSAAAITAILAGVPAIVGPHSAASVVGALIPELECLPHPSRERWAGVLADNQFTLDEMRDGTAWRMLNA